MRSIFFTFITLLFALNSNAQSWQWGRGAGVTPTESGSNTVVTDVHGNVYVAGYYSGYGLDFGTDTLYGTGTNIVDGFFFLAKYDSSGNVLWLKNSSLIGNDALSLATDEYGNVYMTGYFYTQQLIFGHDTLTADVTTYQDMMFLVKYDGDGNVVWARSAPAAPGSRVVAGSVCTDSLGGVYVAGNFISSGLIFGTDTLKNILGGGERDLFLVKYDSSGNVLWARQSNMGLASSDCYAAVSADGFGDVYLGGFCSGCVIYFDGFSAPTEGSSFLVKYNANGVFQWVNNALGNNNYINNITTDAEGNIVAVGDYSGSLVLGADTLVEDSIAAASLVSNIFLAKYSQSGNIIWVKSISGYTSAQAVACDGTGNIFIAGEFANSYADTLVVGSNSIPSTSSVELFIVKYNSSGGPLWAVGTPGSSNTGASDIAINRDGNSIYVAGDFRPGNLLFGSDEIVCPSSYFGQQNMFLAKMNTATSNVSTVASGSAIAVFPNPAATSLTITSTTRPIGQLIITDAIGQTIYSLTPSGNNKKVTVNVAGFLHGSYFIKVNGEAKEFIKE